MLAPGILLALLSYVKHCKTFFSAASILTVGQCGYTLCLTFELQLLDLRRGHSDGKGKGKQRSKGRGKGRQNWERERMDQAWQVAKFTVGAAASEIEL